MAEYIDLDTPLEVYRLRGNQHEPISTTLRELLDFNKIPYTAADVVPVRHGRWERTSKNLMACTVCGNCVVDDRISGLFYCHNCGAKMDAEANE